MGMFQNLSTLAFRQFVEGACQAVGVTTGEKTVQGVVDFLSRHFRDHSLTLTTAMQKANDHAWRAMEVALAGESLWNWLDKADNKAFRQHVRTFLETTPLDGLPGHVPQFRQKCLKELREARKQGLLGGSLEPSALAQHVGEFARFSDPESVLNAEWQALSLMAEELEKQDYNHLSHIVRLKTGGEQNHAILVVAVRFFLRREIETNSELFQGLAWAKFELLQSGQDQGFRQLGEVFTSYYEQMEALLESVHGVVLETHGVVLDIQNEVNNLAQKFDLLQREIRPKDSLSIQNETERQLVKQLVQRYRALPQEERQQVPSLLNAIGKLEVAAGSFASAQKDFAEAAELSQDQAEQAEAHFNLFGASLERSDWETARQAITMAAELAPARYSPFPLTKYEPERILGAGGFGVAFLCRNRHLDTRVVVKTLRSDTLDRDMKDVFKEAQILEQLDHPAIIRLRDCDYADPEMSRPFLVMDFFDGQNLEDYVQGSGTLSVEELISLMRPVCEALKAAHDQNILHRDIKPGNLLVRKESDGSWRVKVIDFGLALKQQVMHTTSISAAVSMKTTLGYSIAGTMDYGAPEQMGKLPGVAVGPYTDIYGFARTCCYALFKTVQPLRKHWREVPDELADLLEQCLSEKPEERLQSFDDVLKGLQHLSPPQQDEQPTASSGASSTLGQVESNTKTDSGNFFNQPMTQSMGGMSQSMSFEGGMTQQMGGMSQTLPSGTRSASDWWKATPGSPAPTDGGAEPIMTLQGNTDAVLSVAFSEDGTQILSGSADGAVRLWDVASGKALRLFHGHVDKVWKVAFLPGEKHAVSASKDKTVNVWNLQSGEAVRTFPNRTNRSVAISPDGQLALTGNISDGMVRMWDLQNGREIRRIKGHMSWVLGLAFSHNGRQALSSSADGTVRLWDVASGREIRRLQGHTDQVWCVAFAPGSNMAISSSADKTVRLWDLRTGKEIHCYDHYQDQVWSVAISPDGRFALSDSDCWTARLWQLGQEREFPPLRGHSDKIISVAFSNNQLAVTGSLDKSLMVWKLPT